MLRVKRLRVKRLCTKGLCTKGLPTTIAFVTACLTSGLITILPSFAQTLAQTLAPCAPPAAGEFILLVSTPTTASETQLKQVLPPTVSIPVCDYQGNRVSRMGGFRNFSDANAWAEYINQAAGLPAFVAQPASDPPNPAAPTPVVPPVTTQPATVPSFAPQPLGEGFAVIVDFFNTPAVAAQLRTAQSRTPGLISYGRQAYLLASYTPDSSAALATLQRLTQQGFQTFIVDSRQVMLLTDAVQIR